MPKPPLLTPYKERESELLEAMLVGLHEWRPDLSYPDSHSDLQACARGIIKRFELKPRAVPLTDWDIEKEFP